MVRARERVEWYALASEVKEGDTRGVGRKDGESVVLVRRQTETPHKPLSLQASLPSDFLALDESTVGCNSQLIYVYASDPTPPITSHSFHLSHRRAYMILT